MTWDFITTILFSITPLLLVMVSPFDVFIRYVTIFGILILLAVAIMFVELDNFTIFSSVIKHISPSDQYFIIRLAFIIMSVSLVIYVPYRVIRSYFKTGNKGLSNS